MYDEGNWYVSSRHLDEEEFNTLFKKWDKKSIAQKWYLKRQWENFHLSKKFERGWKELLLSKKFEHLKIIEK